MEEKRRPQAGDESKTPVTPDPETGSLHPVDKQAKYLEDTWEDGWHKGLQKDQPGP